MLLKTLINNNTRINWSVRKGNSQNQRIGSEEKEGRRDGHITIPSVTALAVNN